LFTKLLVDTIDEVSARSVAASGLEPKWWWWQWSSDEGKNSVAPPDLGVDVYVYVLPPARDLA